MALFRWSNRRFLADTPVPVRAGACTILLAAGLANGAVAQSDSLQSDARVFIGYDYQRADLALYPSRALNGWTVSVERVFPPDAASFILEARGGYSSGTFLDGFCFSICPPNYTPVLRHASNSAYLLLTGLRFGGDVGRVRLFGDLLAGIDEWSFSPVAIGAGGYASPAIDAGVGVDAPIRRRFDIRVRASSLSTNFNANYGWRRHFGVSVGLVVRH
jgi:hypothetical protein